MSEGAKKITDVSEILYRNVHPAWFQGGEVTSAAFRPTPKDQGKLSVDRSSKTTAEASFKLHAIDKGLASEGVFGLSVQEFQDVEVDCFDDPINNAGSVRNDAHAVADFTPHGTSKSEKIGKKLKKSALARGKLYP